MNATAVQPVTLESRETRRWAYVQLAVLVLLWATNWVFAKYILSAISPVDFMLIRFCGAAVVVGSLAPALREPLLPEKGERLRLAIIGLFQWAGLMGISIIGLQYIAVGRAAVLVYTMQLWALPLGWLISRDRITRMAAVGGVIGFIGIVLMVNPRMIDWHDGRVLFGNGLMLVSAVNWAIGSCLYRRRRWQTSFWTQTFWQITWSAVAFILARILFARPRPIAWSVALAAIMVFNWLGATALCAWWWGKVLTTMPVARAGQVVALIPVLITIASALFFGEKITPGLITSMFFIIFGIFLTLRSRM